MRAVDSNVLLRLIEFDDLDQVESAADFIASGAWVSHVALAETIWVLASAYDRDRDQIAAAVEMLLNQAEVTVQEPDVVRAALKRYRERKGVGFTDCLLLEIARKNGHLPFGTFDRDLSKLDGAERIA